MMRPFAAVAAAAIALPALAHAQPYFYDRSGVTIHSVPEGSYSASVPIAGKPPGLVRDQVVQAAFDACRAMMFDTPLAQFDVTPNAFNQCVDDAQRSAMRQYADILGVE